MQHLRLHPLVLAAILLLVYLLGSVGVHKRVVGIEDIGDCEMRVHVLQEKVAIQHEELLMALHSIQNKIDSTSGLGTPSPKSIMKEVSMALKQFGVNVPYKPPPAASIVDPRTHVPDANDTVVVGHGKQISVDDVVFGYDRLWDKKTLGLKVSWKGVNVMQAPNDMMVMASVLWDKQPDCLVEIGTGAGGSAAFYAKFMREYNPSALLVTVDRIPWQKFEPPFLCLMCKNVSTLPIWTSGAINTINGDAYSDNVVSQVASVLKEKDCSRVMVVDDSDHSSASVSASLAKYHSFVSVGQYFVVQGTRLSRITDFGPLSNPLLAIRNFVSSHGNFVIDHSRELLYYSQHLSGFLMRTE